MTLWLKRLGQGPSTTTHPASVLAVALQEGTETLGLNPSLKQQLVTVRSRTHVRCVQEKLHSPRVAAQGEPEKRSPLVL